MFFVVFSRCSGNGNLQQIHRGIDPDDIFDFQKIVFKNQVLRYVLTFGLYFDVWEHYHQTRLEKHAPCLIFIFFGWNRGPNSPKQHLESSSAIISNHLGPILLSDLLPKII